MCTVCATTHQPILYYETYYQINRLSPLRIKKRNTLPCQTHWKSFDDFTQIRRRETIRLTQPKTKQNSTQITKKKGITVYSRVSPDLLVGYWCRQATKKSCSQQSLAHNWPHTLKNIYSKGKPNTDKISHASRPNGGRKQLCPLLLLCTQHHWCVA